MSAKPAKSLDWQCFWNTEPGKTSAQWEAQAFALAVAPYAGFRALQIGTRGINALEKSPIGHRILVCDAPVATDANDIRVPLVAQPSCLPLQNDCVDVAVWPHGPDTETAQTEQCLAEISRVLAPGGVVIISFFNASGLWKLREKYLHRKSVLPEGAGRETVASLKKSIEDAGLTVEGGRFGVYGVDFSKLAAEHAAKNPMLPSWKDKAGDRWWPTFSNVVILVAKKYSPGMKFVGKVRFTPVKAAVPARTIVPKETLKTKDGHTSSSI